MRVLVDSSMWEPTAAALRDAGHDVEAVFDWPADPGDLAILQYAHREHRVLITLDNDFGELAVRRGVPHHGIIRVAMTPVRLEAQVCLAAIAACAAELAAGGIVTATPRRIRVRPVSESD